MSTSSVDLITLPTTNFVTDQISFQVSAELMQNSQQSSPISPTNNLAVVQDSAGKPMLFSIGTDQMLHLIKYDETTPTGWQVINLSTQWSDYNHAVAFDLSQDTHGLISITLALATADQKKTAVFSASMLSNDYTKTDWTTLNQQCQQITGLDPSFQAESIRMGSSDDGHPPIIIIVGSINNAKFYYQVIDAKTSQTLEFPENVLNNPGSLLEVTTGYAIGQRAFFFLYQIGATQTLEATTLADQFQGSLQYDFSPGNAGIPAEYTNLTYTCMTTALGTKTSPLDISSDVYIGTTDGVYVFANSRLAGMQKVTDAIKDVHQIIVTTTGDTIGLWVMASPSKLYYIAGNHGSPYTFNEPILFSDSIVHIAPTRSGLSHANELFVVDQTQQVIHYWQDPNTTLWNQRTITIADQSYLLNFNSYTTHIHLQDQNGMALANIPLAISCSTWSYATINGRIYSLDQDVMAQVPTDALGNLTIILPASDLTAPIIHVQADFIDQTLNIYPHGKITKGIQAIKSGDDLKNAKTTDGSPVIGGNLDDITLNGVAQNISQLHQLSSQITGPMGNNTYVVLSAKNTKQTGKLDVSQSAAKQVTMQVSRNRSLATLSLNSADDIFDDIGDAFGDIWHEIEHFFVAGIDKIEQGITYLSNGVSFLIKEAEQGLNFILKVADKVYNIVLDSIASIYKVLSWIFQLIKVGIETLIKWLGFLFGWDDIWHTHKVLARIISQGVDYGINRMESEIDDWTNSINTTFDQLNQQIHATLVPSSLQLTTPNAITNNKNNDQQTQLFQSPGGNWSAYQLQHSGMLNGLGSNLQHDPFLQFLNDVVIPTSQQLYAALENDFDDLKQIITGGVTIADTLKLFADLATTIIEPIKTMVIGLLKFVVDLAKDIQHALVDDLDIPLLSDLYKWVTGLFGEAEDFSVVNGICLLLAIPVTIIYKASVGSAPFTDQSRVLDDPNLFNTIMGQPKQQLMLGTAKALNASTSKSVGVVYSQVGGLLAAIVGPMITIATLFKLAADEQQVTIKSRAAQVSIVLALTKALLTFPIRKSEQSIAGYTLKISSWLLSVCNTAQSAIIRSPRIGGGITIGIDSVIIVMALIADGLDQADGWTWTTDILSNVSGIGAGVGQVAKGTEVGDAIGIVGWAGSYVSSIVGFSAAVIKLANGSDNEALSLINLGGL
ncbi:MAG: hypothetical protein LCH85_01525 [Chloroflexi bacterium]|nr:hypothetical protein [Chloroflexota bacterium]